MFETGCVSQGDGSRFMRLVIAAVLVLFFASCAGNPPYRTQLRTDVQCEETYSQARWSDDAGRKNPDAETQRIARLIQHDLKDSRVGACWNASAERHAAYDLYSVEFDDQGWLADTASGRVPEETQLTLLMKGLNALVGSRGSADARPLSVIIYTHGWHHSAAPADGNVIAFRRLLESVSVAEGDLCVAHRRDSSGAGNPAVGAACSESESAPVWQKKRRVVGVYLGWRGDSILGSYIKGLSIWDRKHAAETVALGSVQELFARLHTFYLEHECHLRPRSAQEIERCADVRMLTVGHSFGGLITYRALASRMTLGVAETSPDEFDPRIGNAYGYGDLTVLINPAFEATRFEPLAEVAASRPYQGPESGKETQLPLLIVATSETDWATGWAFPLFRWPTTRLERADGAERRANVRTVGWDPRYRTHYLGLSSKPDVCGLNENSRPAERLRAEAHWSDEQRQTNYVGFGSQVLELCDSLELTQRLDWALTSRPYLPLWVIQTNKSVIDGHNDFLNVHFVDFVRQVYYTILRRQDVQMQQAVLER